MGDDLLHVDVHHPLPEPPNPADVGGGAGGAAVVEGVAIEDAVALYFDEAAAVAGVADGQGGVLVVAGEAFEPFGHLGAFYFLKANEERRTQNAER
jgi:hypothetical protein